MEYIQDTIELTNKEREVIRRALCKLKLEFNDSKRFLEASNCKHKEMIALLDGNENNKLAKERLKHEINCLKDNEEQIKNFNHFIKKTELLINKIVGGK